MKSAAKLSEVTGGPLFHVKVLAATILVCAAAPTTSFDIAHAQTRLHLTAGVADSWGMMHGWYCPNVAPECFWSTYWTANHRVTPTAGVAVSSGFRRWFWFEIGATFVAKGWDSGPAVHVVSLEIPMLVHLGYRPRRAGVGASVVGGFAPDLSVSQANPSDFALMGGVEVEVMTAMGWGASLSARHAFGFRRFDEYQLRCWTVSFGVSRGL
ncbi:MAG TPA: hypothetical protein VGA22_10795 [Gemmatimonadales bacterium]|jgi:hypothetical protein